LSLRIVVLPLDKNQNTIVSIFDSAKIFNQAENKITNLKTRIKTDATSINI